ncbi:MAG: DUF2490 domain-containing protein [Bacteroidota bacterium]
MGTQNKHATTKWVWYIPFGIHTIHQTLADNKNEKWSMNLLYSWSRHDFVKHWQISKLGLDGDYHLSKNFGLGMSYEWAIIFPYGKLPISEKWNEHRIRERAFFQDKIGSVKVRAVFELGQFLRNSDFLNRSRVQLAIKFPLLKNKNGEQLLGM